MSKYVSCQVGILLQQLLGAELNTGYYYSRRAMNPSFISSLKQYAEKHLFHIKHPSFDHGFSTRNQVKTARLKRIMPACHWKMKKSHKDIEKVYGCVGSFEKYESTYQSGSCRPRRYRSVREVYIESHVYEYNEIK